MRGPAQPRMTNEASRDLDRFAWHLQRDSNPCRHLERYARRQQSGLPAGRPTSCTLG